MSCKHIKRIGPYSLVNACNIKIRWFTLYFSTCYAQYAICTAFVLTHRPCEKRWKKTMDHHNVRAHLLIITTLMMTVVVGSVASAQSDAMIILYTIEHTQCQWRQRQRRRSRHRARCCFVVRCAYAYRFMPGQPLSTRESNEWTHNGNNQPSTRAISID